MSIANPKGQQRGVISALKRITGTTVKPTRIVEGGQTLFQNPVAHWPRAAGDAAETLGLGTWDPLLNLETDFAVVFEKLNS